MTASLLEILSYRAQYQPDKQAYIFLQNGETESGSLTYGELDRQARAIASYLQSWQGERALLLYPSGLEFITAFFGCLYAGVVAVPAYPPRRNQKLYRLLSIVNDAQAQLALTTTSILSEIEKRYIEEAELTQLKWVATDSIEANLQEFVHKSVTPESLAFLQYTSGSTGTPKGVIVTHGNIIHNQQLIAQGFGHSEKTIGVGWLPLFHDMGLIGNVLQPMYLGIPFILMPPVAFLQKPIRWLKAISKYRATTSGGPNFAYNLCVKKVQPEQLAKLDLSSWDLAYSGAEPVRAETLEQFREKFAGCGFNYSAFYPCYGMAETTLLATGGNKNQLPVIQRVLAGELKQNLVVESEISSQESRVVVGCGRPYMDTTVIIVNPESLTRCKKGQVGEIWVSGGSVASGYWNCPEATQEIFQAYLKDTGEGPFLRTGDWGFFSNKELFVTGRLKDTIIIRGRNHYPQDIEVTVERSHLALRSNCGAAFAVEVEGEERLVVAQEIERSYLRNLNVDEVIETIRNAVSEQHELEVYAVLLLKTGSIPKTSSGKIQRHACKKQLLAETFDIVASSNAKLDQLLQNKCIHEFEQQVQQTPVDNHLSLQAPSTPTKSEAQKCRIETHVDNRSLLHWLRETIVEQIAKSLCIEPNQVALDNSFYSLGVDSLKTIELMDTLGKNFDVSLSPTLLFESPTIAELIEHLVQVHGAKLKEYMPANWEQSKSSAPTSEKPARISSSAKASQGKFKSANDFVWEDDIAVIGMACRFPQAPDLESFWDLLRQGKDAVSEVRSDRWDWHAYYDENPEAANKTYSRWGGFIDHIDQFDPMFFNISPREAKLMDPQQRIFLEVAWETLEHAGYSAERLAQTEVGVFVGCSNNGYYQRIAPTLTPSDHSAGIGNQNAIIANRVSFFLNLRGPSVIVDTLCSSSLVALHMACQNLRAGECTVALAGGVNILLSPEYYVAMSRMKAHSPDGRCKTFDHRANGIVSGEGAGAVLLKPLGRAIDDGDKICAVIKGSAVNHGGQANGLTAPNPRSQADVICSALEAAGVSADSISYVEAHGTGTSLGDPIEIEGLTKAFRKYTERKQFCAIGSVKTNIGHLEPAAGIAQLIKVILAMQHRCLPASLHLEKPNEFIPFAETPFKVNTSLCAWDSEGRRRAGISSFGMGGTNAHVIIEEAPVLKPVPSNIERPVHLLTLSAKSETALRSLARRYEAFLDSTPGVSLANVCFTANTGRSHFAHRIAVLAESTVQLQGALAAFAAGNNSVGLVSGHVQSRNRPKIAFLFTGQGSQSIGMGRQLYETQPTFRRVLERCDQLLRPYLEVPLLSVLYPVSDQSQLLQETAYTQPALFALEYALAELWQSWGIVPDVVIGHSIGEYVAACVAGVFSLEEGLALLHERGRLMQALTTDGLMAVVLADEERVAAAVAHTEKVAIAAVNGPKNIVISGQREAVQTVVNQLQSEGIAVQPLNVSHAFHSPLMEPMLGAFEQTASYVQFKEPRIPLISNLTGQILKAGEIPDASYWCQHIRETVKFAAGMNALAEEGYEIFLEIGPDATLLSIGKRCLPKGKISWLPSLKQGKDDWQVLLESLSVLDVQGADVNWTGFDKDYSRSRLSLPTYPFERRRCWIEEGEFPMDGKKSDGKVSEPQIDVFTKTTRRDTLLSTLRSIVADLLQLTPSEVGVHASFLEMGADSLVLMQAVRTVENTYGIKIAIRQLFEELTTVDALATYIKQNLSPEWASADSPQPEPELEVQPQQPAQPTITVASTEPIMNGTQDRQEGGTALSPALEGILMQQLQVMSKQLDVLHSNSLSAERLSSSENRQLQATDQTTAPTVHPPKTTQQNQVAEAASSSPKLESDQTTPKPFWQVEPPRARELSPRQQSHLKALIARYTKRTQKSKQLAQTYRPVLSDRRSTIGFRFETKEILYPIVGDRSLRSKIWDVDGNEYVDLAMGFGVHLFGHSAPFIKAGLEVQLQQGWQIGPQSKLAGEVAQLFCELTGMERVTFCNSGTEAVMTALRIARAATGRAKIVIFAGSYHGHFDGTLAIGQNADGKLGSAPMVPGVTKNTINDVLVLPYDDPRSLDIIQAHAHELAAVLVEPVQSRQPNLQPKAFLQQLRKLTEETAIPLIFDEVLLGFRIHPGGAQAWFGVEADLITHGKIVGGGTPIGVVAGKATYMDRIDGGMWNYGDASYPEVETTFFSGTFCKNPLSMAAARAVLKHLKLHGPALQQQLNQRTFHLAETLNAYFEQEGVPIQIVHFGSLFRFSLSGNLSFVYQPLEIELLFYHLIEKGVYVWEGRTCFLSTAHTDEDIDYVSRAVKDSVKEMREGGFWPEPASNSPKSGKRAEERANNLTTSPLAVSSIPSSTTSSAQPKNSEVMFSTESPKVCQVDKPQPTGFWERHKSNPSLTYGKPIALDLKAGSNTNKAVHFSLYYFGTYEAEFSDDKYDLLFKSAKFADQHDFTAIWIPERHFHSFGGFSPNPSVISAALARETERIQLRAGSVVLPLHHPIRVAEEWSVVDNLSKGRVGISFASGWHPDDFVFSTESYGNHRELMFQGIEIVQKLWRGESIQVRGGAGNNIIVKIFPMPMQPDLPIWITIVNNPDTYIRAGEIGAGILTNLMGQTVEDLAKNIALYRESLSKHGYNPESGHVTILLHTFVGNDVDIVREKARKPFRNYLNSQVGLFQNLVKSQGLQVDFDRLTEDDQDYILSTTYERYVHTSSLIGTPESCATIIDNLMAVGVDEIACLIDFGVDNDSVLENLPYLNALRERYQNREDGTLQKTLSHPSPANLQRGKDAQTSSERDNTSSSMTNSFAYIDTDPAAATLDKHRTNCGKLIANNTLTIPLTEAQKQLWVLAQMGDDASIAYNQSISLQFRGSLQLVAMRQAVQKIVNRHEALRTTISSQGDFQQILPSLKIDVPLVDFSSVNTSERESKVAEWFKQESRESLELTQDSIFHFHILKLEKQLHLLVLKAHHIVSDGWSLSVILQELGVLYSAECQGVVCQLAPPMQFREYIEWQEQQSQTEKMAAHESYWMKQFANSIPVLDLPTDRPRPPIKTYRGSRQTMRLDASLYLDIKRVSREKGCTLFMTLLSVYTALLHRLTGQDDVVVGIAVAGRSLEGSEGLVGYCAHLLPVRSCVVGWPTFSEYLTTIRDVLLQGYEHQDYPFASLLNKLFMRRDASRSPLITATFNLERPVGVPKMFELKTDLFPQPISFADHDIQLNVTEIDRELVLDCDYNTDLFDATTIERILGHFQTMLLGIGHNPQQHLKELPLLTAAERHQLLVEWNHTQTEYPQDKCVHQLFEAQVERTPDAVAVMFEEQQLTYQQLNQRANQLAHHLQSLGVRPEVLVGICVERSIEMVVGLLGILKAGGAYVPLDSSYPQERLSYMLADSGVEVLLTQQSLLESLPQNQAQVVCLDTDWGAIEQHTQANLDVRVGADNLAYVIYTSGSTGQPKGVMNTHQGIHNRLLWMQQSYQLTSSDRVVQKTPFSFDVSVWEFFWPLLTGARIVVAKTEGHKDSTYLVNLISQQQITTIHFVPSMLQVFLQEPNLENCSCLKRVFCSGEALPFELTRRFFCELECELHNLYGPTEAAIDVTFWQCQPQENLQIVPIGRPIANTQIYILDSHLQPVPIGVPGELYIGGDGLARGYLNRPELTQEKFIRNPFSNSLAERLYKTGDLARYLSDGNIEFLGRIDNQVKIRGFRIELGEIEAVLTTHPQIQQAVVIATEDVPGNKRLVAYIVTKDELLSTHQLREFIKQKLPEYMVPSTFVTLNVLPLTANGKVDRKALPAPDTETISHLQYIQPRNRTEEVIADIFASVLSIQKVGIHDNFFSLGGHSLLATQVISRVRQAFAVDVPLGNLFEEPTVANLSRIIDNSDSPLAQQLQTTPFNQLENREEIEL